MVVFILGTRVKHNQGEHMQARRINMRVVL